MKTLPFLLLLILIGCGKDPFITDNNGTFKDSRDMHEYKWVKIGEQIWMAENLAWLPSVNPSSAGSDTEPRYYVYGYNIEGGTAEVAKTQPNYTTYGVLYNWAAAKTACPSGWHLPTDPEWKKLETYLGMSQADADAEGLRKSGAVGKALKFTSGYDREGNGNNSSGFAALPGGYRNLNGGFDSLTYGTNFWSASENGSNTWNRLLYGDYDGVSRYYYNRGNGFSVRCIKD